MTSRYPLHLSRMTVALATCTLITSGCYSTFTVPVDSAISLKPGGQVESADGTRLEVDDLASVEPVPTHGDHYAADAEGIWAVGARSRANRADVRVSAPFAVGMLGNQVRFAGSDQTFSIARQDIGSLRVRRYNPGATAGAVTGGVVGGAAFVATMVAVGYVLHSAGKGFNLNFGSSW